MSLSSRPLRFEFTTEQFPEILRAHVDRGLLLHYFAERCKQVIGERTDSERDVDGGRFRRYKEVKKRGTPKDETGLYFDRDSGYYRNAKGQRDDLHVIRGPDDPVTLRSLQRADDRQRMRAGLVVTPRLFTSASEWAMLRPGGGRADSRPSGRGQSVSHFLRARTCHFGGRPWIGITEAEFSRIRREVRPADVMAWLSTRGHGQQVIWDRNVAALKAHMRTEAARSRAAARAHTGVSQLGLGLDRGEAGERTAEQRAKRMVQTQRQRLKRWGISDDQLDNVDVRGAYKAAQSKRRTERGEKQRARRERGVSTRDNQRRKHEAAHGRRKRHGE